MAIGNFINITHFDAHKLSGLNKRKNIPMRICYNSVRTKVLPLFLNADTVLLYLRFSLCQRLKAPSAHWKQLKGLHLMT